MHVNVSDTSVPIGQNPSIVYVPNSKSNEEVFLIYNSAQGLDSMYCEDGACDSNIKQTLKCDTKLYSSSLIAIDYTQSSYSQCIKTVVGSVDGKTADRILHCTYYIVIGYGSLTSKQNTNSISFIVCYDPSCNIDEMDEVVIETSFNSDSDAYDLSSPATKTFGYSISLSTYSDLSSGNRYPMFTYSKYSQQLKQFILNIIICLDFHCNTWIGKTQSSFASNPPYVTLGIRPGGDSSVGKGSVSIQETWSSETNFLSIMFTRNVNITRNHTIIEKNTYVLVIGTCGLSSSHLVFRCDTLSGKELNSTEIHNIYGSTSGSGSYLKSNTLSMIQYYPSSLGQSGVPLFVTAYIVNNGQNVNNNELWLLYCFNLWCNSRNLTYYAVRQVKTIDFPQIIVSGSASSPSQQYLPNIIFFENSSALMVMSCNYAVATWNCTDLYYNHPTKSIVENTQFETTSMQISVKSSPYVSEQSIIIFSQVMDESGSGGGIFNGSVYFNCQDVTCYINIGPIYLLQLSPINNQSFSTTFDLTVFVIISWCVSFLTIAGIFSIYKFISPEPFISKNIRNAYLTKVSLDQTRIRPLSYWFFFINLICSAMCIIPWFAYFDYENTHLYSTMIIPPFIPVILTLLELLIFSFPSFINFTSFIKHFSFYISAAYYLSTLLLSYSFSFVWNLKSTNCQTSDLSGLKIIILLGHVATCCVVLYLLFWNIKCFQALKLASPEKLKQPIHQNSNYQNNIHHNTQINSKKHKIVPNSRLLAALNERQ